MTYTITVQNNDPAGCAAANFTMTANVPNPRLWQLGDQFSPQSGHESAIAQGPRPQALDGDAERLGQRIEEHHCLDDSGGSVVVTATIGNCNNQPTVTVLSPTSQRVCRRHEDVHVRVTNNDPVGCADKQYLFNTAINPTSAQWGVTTPNPITLRRWRAARELRCHAQHRWDGQPGTYTFNVTAGSVTANWDATTLLAPTPPSTPTPAQLHLNTHEWPAPLTVQFTDTSTGNVTSWSWDFGDGTALDTSQNPTHQYAIPAHTTSS